MPEERGDHSRSGQGFTVLLIDDDALMREVAKEALVPLGCRVLEADNGRVGLALALTERPDVIVCDIVMPEIDGFEALTILRNEALTCDVPFILLTAESDRSHLRRGMELGADDFVSKPFRSDELCAAVRARIASRSRSRQRLLTSLQALDHELRQVLSHELRTPLHGILGLSELLLDDKSVTSNDAREMVRSIHACASQLQRIIDNLGLWNEPQIPETVSDTTPTATSTADAAAVITQAATATAAARAAATAAARASDIVTDCPPAAVEIPPSSLRKIIEEIVGNALKFSKPGSAVTVSADLRDGEYHVCIKDEGRGMSAQEIAEVGAFRQFERARFEQQGLGLGLYLARRLAAWNGGSVEIRSETGKGTTVDVKLRLASQDSPKASQPERTTEKPSADGS